MYYVYERDFSGNAHPWYAGDAAKLCDYAQHRARMLGLEVDALTGPEEVETALRGMFAVFHVYNDGAAARAGIERGEVCECGAAFFEKWIARHNEVRTRDLKRAMVPQ